MLSAATPEAAITGFSVPVEWGDRGYLVAPVGDLAHFAQFDVEGKLTGTHGRRGDGPGEFRAIQAVLPLDDDSIIVLDRRLTKLTPGLAHVATTALPSSGRAARLVATGNGGLLLNNYASGSRPFLLVDRSLQPSGALGEPAAHPDSLQWLLAADGTGGFWAARVNHRYELRRYDAAGQLSATLTPAAEWFPAWAPEPGVVTDPRRARPRPRLSGLTLDAQGRIWVTATVADAHWAATSRGSAPPGREARNLMPEVSDWADYYDSVIEVVEPGSGAILASRRHSGVIGGATAAGLLWDYVGLSDGLIGIRMIDASLDAAATGSR